MKKKAILFFSLFCIFIFPISAQKHSSVALDDQVYVLLDNLQMRGLAPALPGAKPYSEDQILSAIKNVFDSEELISKLSKNEIIILEDAISKFNRKKGIDLQRGFFHVANEKDTVKLDLGFSVDASFSAAVFNNDIQRVNYDLTIPEIKLRLGLWNFLSARFDISLFLMQAPLDKLGTYDIGGWWYGNYPNAGDVPTQSGRTITTYVNYASFPFSYNKKWDGSLYLLSNVTADGHKGWPMEAAMGFGLDAEIGAGFFDNDLTLRVGRIRHEWAGMDRGASLVLNAGARPFVGGEFSATLFKWLSFSVLFGSLEIPRMGHITGDAFPARRASDSAEVFQNNFAVDMIELNFKYVHFDVGTSLVMRQRFEIGYLFPLVGKLLYQNNIGDFDNLAIFTDLKLKWPGVGNLWFSFFLDEIDMANSKTGLGSGMNFFKSARNMYAFQVGAKTVLPFLPFATLSLRYTKIEPYCYTHQLINNTPWTDKYISTAYMNNGASLGYYLPPNSDEIFARIDAAPTSNFFMHLQYQFIRHGAEYGSQAVAGSSIYSELNPNNDFRTALKKDFLNDGAYQWIHAIKVGGEFNIKKFIKFSLAFYGDVGFVYSYYTNANNPDEYPTRFGPIFSLGMKIF